MEISKELLSEVLGEDVRLGVYNIIDNDGVPQKYNMKITLNGTTLHYWRYYKEWDDGSTMVSCRINIYELAIKCKDWILSKGYYFNIYSFNFSGNTEQEHRVRLLIGNDVVYWGNDSCEETEVEAIILASEWVLKEINEKQLQH